MSWSPSQKQFWWQWVVANGLGELVGLGTVALTGFVAFRQFGEPTGSAQIIGTALGMVALGAFEGAFVGVAQARVLRVLLPDIRGWVRATVVGAMVAWAIGILPSTIMSFGEASGPRAAAGPPLPIVLALAAAMGLVVGPVLAVFQWRRLRRVVPRGVGLWLPANAAAWALGMPIIFLGTQVNEFAASPILIVFAIATSLFLAGAVAGGVHGCALLWLAARR